MADEIKNCCAKTIAAIAMRPPRFQLDLFKCNGCKRTWKKKEGTEDVWRTQNNWGPEL